MRYGEQVSNYSFHVLAFATGITLESVIFLTADQWTKVTSKMEKQWINDIYWATVIKHSRSSKGTVKHSSTLHQSKILILVENSIIPRCESGGGVPGIHSLHMHLKWHAPLYFQGQKTWSPPISYTFLHLAATIWLYCSTSHVSAQRFIWQQHFFGRLTNVDKRLCVVSLASKQLWYSALQVGCQTCIVDVSIVYITTTHKALGALLTAVTVKTDLQSTVVKKFHFLLHHDYAYC